MKIESFCADGTGELPAPGSSGNLSVRGPVSAPWAVWDGHKPARNPDGILSTVAQAPASGIDTLRDLKKIQSR